jgi:hypothetical protein
MSLSALGIFSAAGAGGVAGGTYELIATTILGSSSPLVTLSDLGTYSSTYKHLQIRYTARSDRATYSQDAMRIRINGNSTNTNYAAHYLQGGDGFVASTSGSGSPATSTLVGRLTCSGSETGSFNAGVIDILDAYSTTKNKTIRYFSGQQSQNAGGFGGTYVNMGSTLFALTDSITSVGFLSNEGTNLVAGTRFSIYGIKG